MYTWLNFSQSFPARVEKGMGRILHHKKKVALQLPLSWHRLWREGGGGFAYLEVQRLGLLKVVCAGISACTLKMAHFLKTINWN